MTTFRVWHVPVGAVLAALTACATADPPHSGRIVTAAWARIADSGATGGAYISVLNADSTPATLTGVSSPQAVAAELHESMQHDGMSHMMPRDSVSIAARDSLVMTPGGLHIMLVQLKRALVAGDSVPVTLRFSHGDPVRVNVPVRAP